MTSIIGGELPEDLASESPGQVKFSQGEFVELTLPGIDEGEILVIRSKRRKKSISAYRQGGRIVISIPARLSKADERAIVPEMIAKIRSQEADITPSEASLAERIDQLLSELAPEITARPSSVNWRPMRERWGSCTGVDRTIRISDRLKLAPKYALDYLLFHEAIHLYIPDHGPEFTEILSRFEESELASAYLDGYEAAERSLLAPVELKKLSAKGQI
jgi:predicted metal-dependent hydrolase|uniref:M48 metallopeptidase family protein n=1 Tax=Candidatus Planktophila sp. TaxID=2175601 RepID=UPI00404B12A6